MKTEKRSIGRHSRATDLWPDANEKSGDIMPHGSEEDRRPAVGRNEITFGSWVTEIFGSSGRHFMNLDDTDEQEGSTTDDDGAWQNNEDPDAGTGLDLSTEPATGTGGNGGNEDAAGSKDSSQGTGSTQGDTGTDNDLATDEKIGGNEAAGAGAAGGTGGGGTTSGGT